LTMNMNKNHPIFFGLEQQKQQSQNIDLRGS
jgi:hypothetical protein